MSLSEITTIHSLIRDSRQRKYKSVKDFYDDHGEALHVSYSHYSAVEKGTKFPDIQLTIAISKSLKIDLKLMCHLWAKEQMPNAETRSFFEPVPGIESQGLPSTVNMQLDEFYIFTEKQIPAFAKIPALWDVLMFIMSFWDSVKLTERTIAKAMNLELADVKQSVEWLRNEGMIYSENGILKSRRRFFHLPNTEAFREVRDQNFRNTAEDILRKLKSEDLSNKEAYRTTYTRQLTRVQAQELCKHLDTVVGHFGNMSDLGKELYSFTVAFGPRAKVQGDIV